MITTLDRFNCKYIPEPNTGCWLWTATLNGDGYGSFWQGNKVVLAHRYSWIINRGKIPKKLMVCHKCDITQCVNPDHLFLGTMSDNAKDSSSKLRHSHAKKTHCPQGHSYDLDGRAIVIKATKNKMSYTKRYCVVCTARRDKLRTEKRRLIRANKRG